MVKRLEGRAEKVRDYILDLGRPRLEEGEIIQTYSGKGFNVGYYNPRKSKGEILFLSDECGGIMPHSPVASDKGNAIPYEEIEGIWRRGDPHSTYDLIYHFDDEGNGREGGVRGREPVPQSDGDKIKYLK